jgi:predicted cobalt transporter CbtA
MSLGDLLRRGLVAGAAAGIAAALMVWLVVEPVLRQALAVEDARGAKETAEVLAAGGHVHSEEPLVSRTLQVIGGMGTALVIGLLFGLVFAVVFAAARHRLPGASDFGRSLTLAALGFGTFALAPMLTIPANPPAVGDPGSVNQRELIFVLTIVISVALVIAAFSFDRFLSEKNLAAPARIAIVAVSFVVVLATALVALPDSPDSILPDMGAQIVWDFRIASIGLRAVLFAVIGLVFGLLVSRKASTVESDREAVSA